MTTLEHIAAYQAGQASYDALMDIARSIRLAMIEESEACAKLLRREFPKNEDGHALFHNRLTVFGGNNGRLDSVTFEDTTVTITEECYGSGDTWRESEQLPGTLFIANDPERRAMIRRIIYDRFNARVQELRAAPLKAAAKKEAKEKAEYERLQAKYGNVDVPRIGA